MKKGIYAIRDRISGDYGTIFLENNEETAKRLVDIAKIPYKSDCELYYLGDYDTKNGTIDSVNKPEFIKNLVEVAE